MCLTRHFRFDSLLGLIYFVPPSDSNVHNNTFRCVPCELFLFHGWDYVGDSERTLGHKCGFHTVHAMYATNVSDWLSCMNDEESKNVSQKFWGRYGEDHFVPSSADELHVYKQPMIAFSDNMNIGHSLFDHLLVYVQHWSIFRRQNKFPFSGVASFTFDQCLDEGEGASQWWYCEVLRAMDAFGGAHEISLLPNIAPSTLNCFEKLYTVHLGLPRINGYGADVMPSKEVFDEFRQVLFDRFDLPRGIGFKQS